MKIENNRIKEIAMINLGFMNKAVELTDGNEFRLLYVIANTMSLKKEGHTRIYREMLADILHLSTKQITRLTNSLEEKGLIKKDLVCERDKTVCYYSLNLDIIGKKSTSKLDKNVPLNNSKKEIIKEIKVNNSNNIKYINKYNNIEEFKKEVDSILINIDNENDLINMKGIVLSNLNSNHHQLGTNQFNRCSSYFNRIYQERLELIMAESK